ncbi:cytochrome d ubiquinol oxidase subunit II [Olivibacter sp. SDN3]|uniref:cytochrome d ubiquinol oxidase subunit II n=1 Tax=Olivibacter sp. SDN3 TaxID=2764720 RepID=UPI0016514D95|nr:cytochrome d ubiquinol oxidase subunit II [Olivibacter sp. SDN3]QNL50925.1 cytochrome d ubiquinol oxidase subunit II [Olivibacter sp. SDN3]
MLYVVIAFLWASIWLYLLLGGADFGAGVIELVTNRENRTKTRSTMYRAIGPIWEANHMWLIIAIVILFVGFPKIYTTMSVFVHIPLTAMLLGIIARGTAFVFRNYDAVDDHMQNIYNRIFVYSSAITPFFLGIIAASTVSGQIDPNAGDFLSAYLYSWLNSFGLSVGLFTVCICGFLAAIYIIGEVNTVADRQHFIRMSKRMIIAAFFSGGLVFAAAQYEGIPLVEWIFGQWVGSIAIALASISLLALWFSLDKNRPVLIRLLAGFQISMILLAATYVHFPNIVLLKDDTALSLLDDAGLDKTIEALAWALMIGSVFILPSLFYLIYSFERRKNPEEIA